MCGGWGYILSPASFIQRMLTGEEVRHFDDRTCRTCAVLLVAIIDNFLDRTST